MPHMPMQPIEAEPSRLDAPAVIFFKSRLHACQNAHRSASTNQLDRASVLLPQSRFELGPNFLLQELLHPRATGAQLLGCGRVAVRNEFNQPHRAQWETLAEMFMAPLPEDEFGASTTNIQQQNWLLHPDQSGITRHALKDPIRFLVSRDNFDFQPGALFDRVLQFLRVDRVARCAG